MSIDHEIRGQSHIMLQLIAFSEKSIRLIYTDINKPA